MGIIIKSAYPIWIQLTHDDNEIGTTPEGDPIYTVTRIDWEERSNQNWNVVVTHPTTGNPIPQTISALETGFKNLPPPVRVPTDYLGVTVTKQ